MCLDIYTIELDQVYPSECVFRFWKHNGVGTVEHLAYLEMHIILEVIYDV